MFYWIMAIVTLVLLVFHFMSDTNWAWYKGLFGSNTKVVAVGGIIVGTLVWPVALIYMGARMVLKSKS